MSDLNSIPEFSKYFRAISPSEININNEDIFYRDKYNEILNFIKLNLTNNQDLVLKEYVEPKGAILLYVNRGTDILDFLKLISMNYYIDFIEYNDNEVIKTPEDFIKSLSSIVKVLKANIEKSTELNNKKRLFLINQHIFRNQNFTGKNLVEFFIKAQQNGKIRFNCKELDLILVWINYDLKEIRSVSADLYDIFDLFLIINMLNQVERETVFRDFLEKNPKIVFDIDEIVKNTQNWEVNNIKQLLKIGILKHFINYELNSKSNEITDSLLNLIKSGEYLPTLSTNTPEISDDKDIKGEIVGTENVSLKKERESVEQINDADNFAEQIRETRISDFMLNQLYENAASKHYNELLIIIDKLKKNEPLEENDRKLLAIYPFILNESPNRAQINLEKAKKRVDRIKQVFGN
ncbi:MAG: hypothetical protein ACFFB0_03780 [Promethearchaeota archaeon]